MFQNYLKIAIRNLLKYKFYSIINIVGLSIGITTFLFIFLYVNHELSYDQYHVHADRIVRLDAHAKLGENEVNSATNSAPAGPVFTSEIPEIEAFCRFRYRGSYLVKYEEHHYKEEQVIFVDSSFFNFFNIPVVAGNPETALTAPNSAVITQNTAVKYFGSENPIGKNLILDNNKNYNVTAVIENIPTNTHFNFDLFLSIGDLTKSQDNQWGSFNYNTYVLLKEGTDWNVFKEKMQKTFLKYFEPVLKQYVGVTYDQFIAGGNYIFLDFTPLTKIHLYSDKEDELAANSDIRYIYIFGIIGLFILFIAGINFVNLSTARAMNRAKEVGVRKVVGAMRHHLIRQFLSESTLVALTSLLLAIGLIQLLLPWFNSLSGKMLTFSNFMSPRFLMIALLVGIITGLLSGIYPAFYLSAFRPAIVIKGNFNFKNANSLFRNSLVIFQFFITTILIVCTVVVYKQLQFMQNKKLGFNKEQILIINDAYALKNNVHSFKTKVLSNPFVKNASVTGFLPVESSRNSSSFFKGNNPTQENAILISNWVVDFDYVKTMGMEMIKGRDFDAQLSTDSMAIIINEELARQVGYEDPIGKTMSGYTSEDTDDLEIFTIIGVIKNFHYASLRDAIKPLALFYGKNEGAISLRFQTEDINVLIQQLAADWQKMAPDQPFSYQFMDERFSRMFEQEQRLGKIIGGFAFLTIFIACIGLLGLATFITQQRTKEIGIRKVLGASIPNLVYLLCKDFGKLILIAFLFAVPVSWYFMQEWLTDFAYATSVGISVFLLAGLLILMMTILSVFYQSTRVALINPVETLKQE